MSNHACGCPRATHECRLVVVTGGPGAGKTALLEMVRRNFCEHVAVLPEAAGIVFGGGFPRRATRPARRAAQRAIYRVQTELERLAREEGAAGVALCDRGTVDGIAYWPDEPAQFFRDLDTTIERELARYAAIIHLRTPPAESYNHANPLRIESAREAALIDDKIAAAWSAHPCRFFVDASADFVDKVARALQLIRRELPECCAAHTILS